MLLIHHDLSSIIANNNNTINGIKNKDNDIPRLDI